MAQKFQKTYRVKKDLIGELSRVMLRNYYDFEILSKEEHPEEYDEIGCDEETVLWATNAPSGAFHKMIQRARCEKLDQDEKGSLTHVTRKEADASAFPESEGKGKFKATAYVVVE